METRQCTTHRVPSVWAAMLVLVVLAGVTPHAGFAASDALSRQAEFNVPFAGKGYDLLELLIEERVQLERYCLRLEAHWLDDLGTLREKIKQLEDGLREATVNTGRVEKNEARRKRYAATVRAIEAITKKEQELQGGIDQLIAALKQKDLKTAAKLLGTADAYFDSIQAEWYRLVLDAAGDVSHKSIKDEYNALQHADELVLAAAAVEFHVMRYRRTSAPAERKRVLDLLRAGEKHITEAGEGFHEGLRDRRTDRSAETEDLLDALSDVKDEWEDAGKAVKRFLNLNDPRQRAASAELTKLDAALQTLREESRELAGTAEKLVLSIVSSE